jgi:uncharacterized membrane protein YgcG
VILADILIVFTSICGAALTLFLLTQERELLADVLRQFRARPPEVRRKRIRAIIITYVVMAAVAGLVFAAYAWGARTWTARTGAILAILVFVIVMATALTAMVVEAYREQNQIGQGSSTHPRSGETTRQPT